LYSEVGIGTTFKLYLPAVGQDQPQRSSSAPAPTGGRVLLVDDDLAMLRLCGRLLTKVGYCVTTASDGDQAIELMRRTPDEFDLAILDLAMPHVSGLETCHALHEIRPELPVVFCTGFDPFGPQAEAVRRGGFPIVEKPLNSSLLLHNVRAAIREAPVACA
jgi:DNA-binding response OmpR family regulator